MNLSLCHTVGGMYLLPVPACADCMHDWPGAHHDLIIINLPLPPMQGMWCLPVSARPHACLPGCTRDQGIWRVATIQLTWPCRQPGTEGWCRGRPTFSPMILMDKSPSSSPCTLDASDIKTWSSAGQMDSVRRAAALVAGVFKAQWGKVAPSHAARNPVPQQ